MNKSEAAALLSLEEDEVFDVLDSPAGPLIKTTDGQTYIVVPEDRTDAEGKTGVMFLAAPSPKYGGTFPVYAQPGAEDEIRTVADAKSFRDLAEELLAGEELDEPERADAPPAKGGVPAGPSRAVPEQNEAEAEASAQALATETGQQDKAVPAPGPEHAEEIVEATTKGAGAKAKEGAQKQAAKARSAAKKATAKSSSDKG